MECAPKGGGGGRGSYGNSSSGGGRSSSGAKTATRTRGGIYLIGGLYPARRPVKEELVKVEEVKSKNGGITAGGIIAMALGMITLCCGVYYALYLCDLCKTTSNYQANLANQNFQLISDKPRPEENGNGNGNIPMIDMNNTLPPPPLNNMPNNELNH